MMDINIFKFIETVKIILDIPIVLMSEVYKYEHVRKAIDYGVSDFICTPTIQELKVIWKFVQHRKLPPSSKNKRDDDENGNERTLSPKNDNSENTPKKPRWRWTDELHEKFIFALKQLGLDGATPKKILELMDVPNLAKHNVSSYLQKFRKCVKEKSIADWTQITSEMTSNQIRKSEFRALTERKLRSMSPGKLTVPEQSIYRFNMQNYAPIVPMSRNSNLIGQSNVHIATSAPLAGNSNYMGQNLNYMHRDNASIMSGVNNMHVPTQNPNHIKQNQSRNVSALMQQNYYSVVNQTDNSFSPMARYHLNMGQKYAPTAILPESSAAVAQTKHFLPLRNAYSLLNQLQNNIVQIGQNESHIQQNTAPMSNLLENNSANIVQNSNAMWNCSANMVQNSNVIEHDFTIQGINNFEMRQNSNDVNQVQNCLNNFTGNSVNQNSNAMEFNSGIEGIGGFGMIQNSIVGQNECTEAHYQGYNMFSDVNENSIGQNHNAMGNNSAIQGIGTVGMMQNQQTGINEYMGVPYQGQSSIGAVKGNFIGQSPNALENSSEVQGNGVVEMMQNHQIDINEYLGASYQGQSSIGALNGNYIAQNPNALGNSSAVQGNGGVGMMQSHSIGENAITGVTYQVQNSLNAVIGNSGVGFSEKSVNVDDFVSELLNLDADGEEPNN